MTVADGRNVQSRIRRRRLLKRYTIYELVTLTAIFAGLFVVMNIFMSVLPTYYSHYSWTFTWPSWQSPAFS